MEVIEGLSTGFAVALQWNNLMYVTIGVLLGTTIGLLPGLGPTAAIAVLIPITYGMDATSAIIMMAGIYYGCMYGGRIPAILLNVPGDASSVVTTLDGYPLAKEGRAGPALGITAVGSFIGGTFSILALSIFAPIVAGWASQIGPPETVVLGVSGLLLVALISTGSKLKATSMAMLGLILAAIGTDVIGGSTRLTFGSMDLGSGIDIIPLAVGLFGLGEILILAEKKISASSAVGKIKGIFPTREDLNVAKGAIARSSIIGFLIGVLPGGGGALSSMVSYGVQKNFSKKPEKFGKGAVDGLAATETADNASSNSAFIPLLTLGIPPNSVLALLFGVLMVHNVAPGPSLIDDHPGIFWGVIASMYVGNLILLILNLPAIGIFVQILRVPSGIILPLVIVIAFCGVYAANNRLFDVYVAAAMGVLGYLLKKFKFDMTPIILAFILGPVIENGFRRSMIMSGGDPMTFFQRPGSIMILCIVAALSLVMIYSSRRGRKLAAIAE